MRWSIMFTLLPALLITPASLAQYNMGTGEVMTLFGQHCAQCHGDQLQGGGLGSSLVDNRWTFGDTDEALFNVIKQGRSQVGMPAWGASLSNEQIRSLVILIREQQQLALNAGSKSEAPARDKTFTSKAHTFRLEKVGEGTDILWGMDFLPNGDLLATQQDGKLWRFRMGARLGPIKQTPNVLFAWQGGLLDVKVHPDYDKNGWIYLSFSKASDKGSMTALVRGKLKGNHWHNEEEIFSVPEQYHLNTGHHYGSRMDIRDGYLFFSVGDRGEQDHAQDLGRPNGKIHRLHDDGRVPANNPFATREGALASIWSYGHRNPQGLIFHPKSGALWSSELGPRGGDEINVIAEGQNYGWPLITAGMNYDGTAITDKLDAEGMRAPLLSWTPSISPGGIAFYHGKQFPGWDGNLFVSGMGSEELHRLAIADNRIIEDEVIMRGLGRVRDVAMGPDGHLYVILNTREPLTSTIYRIVATNLPTTKTCGDC